MPATNETSPFFSVIIPTRNRPAQFRRALETILAQSFEDLEIIAVNDGSALEHRSGYEAALALSPRVRALTLQDCVSGHGPAFARNAGAAQAAAPYLCFLDDDDLWIDREHLARAHAVLCDAGARVDAHMADQVAFRDGVELPRPIWTEDLAGVLRRARANPTCHGAYRIELPELLKSAGFCHINALIIRRELYVEIGGMDEGIRWEEDRDFYFRTLDRASAITYAPITVAVHNAPSPSSKTSASTMLGALERYFFRLRVLDGLAERAVHPEIHAYAKRHHGYTLKHIAVLLSGDGRHSEAASYARRALIAAPTAKWCAYTTLCLLRAAASSMRRQERLRLGANAALRPDS